MRVLMMEDSESGVQYVYYKINSPHIRGLLLASTNLPLSLCGPSASASRPPAPPNLSSSSLKKIFSLSSLHPSAQRVGGFPISISIGEKKKNKTKKRVGESREREARCVCVLVRECVCVELAGSKTFGRRGEGKVHIANDWMGERSSSSSMN